MLVRMEAILKFQERRASICLENSWNPANSHSSTDDAELGAWHRHRWLASHLVENIMDEKSQDVRLAMDMFNSIKPTRVFVGTVGQDDAKESESERSSHKGRTNRTYGVFHTALAKSAKFVTSRSSSLTAV